MYITICVRGKNSRVSERGSAKCERTYINAGTNRSNKLPVNAVLIVATVSELRIRRRDQ